MGSPPKPGVITYAELQRSLHALFLNNEAMARAVRRAISLRDRGKPDRQLEEEILTYIAKDKDLMAKVKRALRAHYKFLREAQIILPSGSRRARGNGEQAQKNDPERQLALITLAASRVARAPRRRRASSTMSDSEPTQD
jgi:hypothetical protein